MPPKREQSEVKDSQPKIKDEEPKVKKRPLHQSIVDILPGSTKEGKKNFLVDIAQSCRDALISKSGWDLFLYFYNKRNEKISVSNAWMLDIARLIVPNVFFDVEFIRLLAKNYHSATKTVRFSNDTVLVEVTRKAIIECFGLNKQALTKMDL